MFIKFSNLLHNGYKLKVEGSKYLIFESRDHAEKLFNLEIIAFDLIDFCEFSEDNEEKQDEIYSHMLAMEIYLKSLPLIKIKVCDDEFDFNTQDIDDFEDPFGIEFPTLDYYFRTIHIPEDSDFFSFHNNLKSEEVKEKFRHLFKAVSDVLFLQIDK